MIILILLAAIVMEFVDSGLGMLYGTVLTPLLINFGYDTTSIIPAVLFSQALGGATASYFHHLLGNADLKPKTLNIHKVINRLRQYGIKKGIQLGLPKDLKISLLITTLGVIATILSVYIALNIPKFYLNLYIGILVLIMGIIIITKIKFRFTWKKIVGLGILSSFNKGLSGGGFGPVVTAGQIISGNEMKNSIASTTLAEVPICLTGFISYLVLTQNINMELTTYLSIGAIIGAPFGAYFTRLTNIKWLKPLLGITVILLGIWTLIKLF